MTTTFTSTCIAAALCLAALTGLPRAYSAEPPAFANVEVHELFPFKFRFKVDDLASTRGAQRVYLDLQKQARRACTAQVVSGSRILRTDQQCIAALITSVVQRIGSVNLLAQQSYVR